MQGGNGGAFERIMLLLGEAHHALSSVKTADFRHLTSDESVSYTHLTLPTTERV
mgnify:CR=1 FL=1